MLKYSILYLCIFYLALNAHAQDFALQRLEKSPRHQEWVTVKQGDREVHAFVVYPEIKKKATAVVIIHENRGLIRLGEKCSRSAG
jgi:carboxymethylenebutenolidase